MLRILLLSFTTLYAVISFLLAFRDLRRRFTKTTLLALIASLSLLCAPVIAEPTARTSIATLALIMIASCALYANLRRSQSPHWASHVTRLVITIIIIIGFHFYLV